MYGYRKITPEMKDKIKELSDDKVLQRLIAERFDISQNAVSRVLIKYKEKEKKANPPS